MYWQKDVWDIFRYKKQVIEHLKILKMYALLHKEVQKDREQTIYASYQRDGKTFHFYFYPLLYGFNFFPMNTMFSFN